MIVKYLSKFVLEILPSVVATIIGAYIVNHYIVARPATNAPVAAAVSTVDPKAADPKTADSKAADPKKTDARTAKADAKGSEKGPVIPSDVAGGAPDPATSKKNTADKATEKSVDKPTDTASLPVETRRHQPAPRDKTVAKTPLAPAQNPAPAVAAVSVVPPVEASPTLDERRDANDMARAAIERLRNSSEASRAPGTPRVQDPRVQDSPRVVSAPVQPLPPAIMVSTPSGEAFNPNGTAPPKPPYAPVARVEDPRRPPPPADIPTASRPLDLHAEATASMPEQRTTVADDMLSAAKSVFHAVLPR
jgi:hypothetical protein